MEPVEIKNKKIVIKVNEEFYPRKFVDEVRNIFSKFCKVDTRIDGKMIEIVLEGCFEDDTEKTGYEFFNQLLVSVKRGNVVGS